ILFLLSFFPDPAPPSTYPLSLPDALPIYSWLYGRFNDFSGTFSFDEKKPEESKVSVVINTDSVDSNHAERDKHLRAEDFLYVSKYPQAKFESTSVEYLGDDKAKINGKLTLRGVTKDVVIDAKRLGGGQDQIGR